MKSRTSSNLSNEISAELKDRIIRWHYPPGYRFTEQELCEEFDVSRSPIREALRTLVENGLVDKEPHKGYTVKLPDTREINELYEVRLALELFIVELLAKKGMPTPEREKLRITWSSIQNTNPQNVVEFAEKDEEFHETLAACTDNNMFVQYLHSINERLHFVRMMDITSTERLRVTCEQHLQILDCLKHGSVTCACEAMRMNVHHGRANVEQAVKAALAKAYLGI